MHDLTFVLDAIALLVTAVVVVPVFQRLRLPAVLAYLTAGVILGPHTPGPVVDPHTPSILAEFGIVFLLFAIGLELPLSRLRAMRRHIFGLGLAQVVVTATVLALVARWFGLSAPVALVVGAMLAFSSTATVLKMLVERGETVARYGRVSVAVLIFQDLAVVPLLALLPLLAADHPNIAEALALAGGKAVIAIVVIMILGRFVVRPLYRFVAASRNPEVFTATSLCLVLVIGWVTAQVGMSMALGAFLGGLLLADTAYRHQVEADIEPFRGLLLGLFFMTVGMSLDLPFIFQHVGVILALTVALLAAKSGLLFALCRLSGLGAGTAIRVGLLLAQGGEFAFVVITSARGLGIMGDEVSGVLTSVVAISMALTPALGELAARIGEWWEGRWGKESFKLETSDLRGHVLIAGYGRVGRAIAHVLTAHGIPHLALDLDPNRVAEARAKGLPVYYGDASHIGVLRAAGIGRARAAVVTLNRPSLALKAVTTLRQQVPDLPIIARAHDLGQKPLMEKAGASEVVAETVEASLNMAAHLLRADGLDEEAVNQALASCREGGYAKLIEG